MIAKPISRRHGRQGLSSIFEFREHAPPLLLRPFQPPSRRVTIVHGHCLFGTPDRANSIRHQTPAIYFDLEYAFAALLH